MRANERIMALVAGGLILLLAGTAHAATVRGQLVFASDNSPAPYIAVRLNSGGKGASESVYSGNDGKYYIRNVPPGSYQLEVWRGGKAVSAVAITVQEPVADVPAIRVP